MNHCVFSRHLIIHAYILAQHGIISSPTVDNFQQTRSTSVCHVSISQPIINKFTRYDDVTGTGVDLIGEISPGQLSVVKLIFCNFNVTSCDIEVLALYCRTVYGWRFLPSEESDMFVKHWGCLVC